MNISPVNANETKVQNFRARMPKYRIHLENELDAKLMSWLDKNQNTLEQDAKKYKSSLSLAQRKTKDSNVLLANAGPVTSSLDLNKILNEKDIMSFLRDVFQFNNRVKTEGLSKTLNTIV